MKATIPVCLLLAACIAAEKAPAPLKKKLYQFQESRAYAALSRQDKDKLNEVQNGFAMLWGALEMYADDHGDNPPDALERLVPMYLPALPRDPFATTKTAAEKELHGSVPSLDGHGFRYRRGSQGNRAWTVSSAGLPDFPYLSATGNIGLYKCKGLWISGMNPTMEGAAIRR